MASLINRFAGEYLLESQIGAGSVGTVFRARHSTTNRLAAVKVIHQEVTKERSFRARFLRAADAARLAHPNAVAIEEVGETGGQYFIRMELLAHGSLRTLLVRRADPLPLQRGVELVRQVAQVLSHAHGRGVLHRDLKPENALLGPPGADGIAETVRVADWGLTQLIDTGVTVVGNRTPGSPRYMSPEQCKGALLDHRSDIYSFGVVLYEVATGLPPFQVNNFADAFDKHVSAPPPAPRSVKPDLPASLEGVIMRCLAKKPDDRFQSADEIVTALQDVLVSIAPQRQRIHIRMPDEPRVAPPPAQSPSPSQPKAQREIVWRSDSSTPSAAATGRPPAPSASAPPVVAPPTALPPVTPVVAAPVSGPPAAADPRGRVHLKSTAIDDAGPTLPIGLGQGQRGGSNRAEKTPSKSKRIQIILDRTAIQLVPDVPVVLRATLYNAGRTTEHFPLSIEGVPASWVQLPSDPPQLNPQERTVVSLTIRVPKSPENRAGLYTATIRARALLNPNEYATAVGEWTVAPFAAPSIALVPARITTWRRGVYTIRARNGGNAPARFAFAGSDDEQLLRYEFLDEPQLTLQNGQSADVRVRVRGKVRWLGNQDARAFTLRADPVSLEDGTPAAPTPAAIAAGQFVRRALVPTWAPPILGLALVGAFFALRPGGVNVRLTPARVQVEESKAERVSAAVSDRKGELLPDQTVTYAIRDTNIAVVSDSGIVEGKRAGKTFLIVSYGRTVESAEIEVVAGQVETMVVDPTRLVLSRGQSRNLRVTAKDATGKRMQRAPRWESSDPLVATVGGDGRVVAKDSGLATVTARIGEKFASATVTVLAPPAAETPAAAAGGGGDAEDCTAYEPGSLKVHKLEGGEGFAVASDPANPVVTLDTENDARRALSLARAYKKHCYLGRSSRRPNKNVYTIEYWLEPTGAAVVIDNEQCFAYNPSALRVVENGNMGFSLADPPRRLLLADSKADAEKIWEHAQKRSQMCFIGQGNRRNNQRDYIAQYWK
jgi:serine/threonine protein kinase